MTDATATLSVRHLVRALKQVEAVRKVNHIPALSVAVACFDDRPHLKATDLDQELTVYLMASCTGEFQAAIDPPTAISALGNSSGAATVSLDNGAAQIATGQVAVRGPRDIDLNDLPAIDTGTPAYRITIEEGALHAALRAVRFAISTEETRYYLNGVFLTAVDGEMAMVATDGHYLSRHLMGMPYAGPHVIIPACAVATLLRMLRRDSDAPITIIIGTVTKALPPHDRDTHAILVEGDFWHLKSRCINGIYPRWDVLMQKAVDAIAGAQTIHGATVTQAHVSRFPKHNCWRQVTLDPGAGTLRVRNDFNEDAVAMPMKGFGETFLMAAHLLRQMVGAVGDVELTGSTPDGPFIATTRNPKTVAIVMPMKAPDKKGKAHG